MKCTLHYCWCSYMEKIKNKGDVARSHRTRLTCLIAVQWRPSGPAGNQLMTWTDSKWVCSFLFFQRELLWRHLKNTAITLFCFLCFFLSSPECDSILPLLVGSRYMLYSIIAQSNCLCYVVWGSLWALWSLILKGCTWHFQKVKRSKMGFTEKRIICILQSEHGHKLEYYVF